MIVVAVDNISAFSFSLYGRRMPHETRHCSCGGGGGGVRRVGGYVVTGYESFECVHKWPLMLPDNEQTSSNTINLCIRKIMRCLMFVTVHQVYRTQLGVWLAKMEL